MANHLLERFDRPGPKRILACDGGGIRGILALQILEKIEKTLEKRHGRFVPLHEYYDLIIGTSTGAIIAAGLATGHSAGELSKFYLQFAEAIFGKKHSLFNPFDLEHALSHQFDADGLERKLVEFFGQETLGSEKIKTGLAVIAKRADTNSTWMMFNHPRGKYFEKGNKDFRIVDVLRASSAAPTYFLPQLMKVKGDQEACFVDGGISFSNNPTTQALLLATANAFPFGWKMGKDRLFLTSVGTGVFPTNDLAKSIRDKKMLHWAKAMPNMFLQDANYANQMLMQWMTDSPTSVEIDREMGALENDLLAGQPLFSYARYNVEMSLKELPLLGLPFQPTMQMIDEMGDMAALEHVKKYPEIGQKYAEKWVKGIHFPERFDLGRPAPLMLKRFENPPFSLQEIKPKAVQARQMQADFEVEGPNGLESGAAGDWAVLGADGFWRAVAFWDFQKNYEQPVA